MAYTPGDAANYDQDAFTADAVAAEAAETSTLEADRKAEAAGAGVQDARFIGYAEVLEVYNRRSDTEPLADRRARSLATDPAQQDFTRAADYTGNSTETETRYPADTDWTDTDFSPVEEPDPGP